MCLLGSGCPAAAGWFGSAFTRAGSDEQTTNQIGRIDTHLVIP